MSITITGASDDLIEVDGDIYEEFNALGNAATGYFLGFSNGVVLKVRYDEDGIWRIVPIKGEAHIAFGTVDTDTNDVATLLTPADWVVCGTEWATANRPPVAAPGDHT